MHSHRRRHRVVVPPPFPSLAEYINQNMEVTQCAEVEQSDKISMRQKSDQTKLITMNIGRK